MSSLLTKGLTTAFKSSSLLLFELEERGRGEGEFESDGREDGRSRTGGGGAGRQGTTVVGDIGYVSPKSTHLNLF